MALTNWQKNIKTFYITTFFQWFYVAIGVWVLIWRQYLSWEQIALVTASGLVVSLLLELPSGALADLIGRKKTVLLGRFLGVLGFAMYSIADSFPLFVLANILYHANWAFESGALSALLFDSLKENNKEDEHYQKTEANGFFYATIGMAIASIVGGYLYTFNVHLPYMVSTVVAILAFISAFWLEEPQIDSEKFSVGIYMKQNWEGLLHIFRQPLVRSISIFSILIDFVAYVGLWYLYEPRLAEGGFPASWLGMLVAGTYLIRAVGTKMIPLIMKLGDKYVPYALTAIQTFGSLLSFIESKFGAISSVYMRKFSDGLRKPILNRLQNEQIDSKYRATSLSAISLFSNLLIAAAGPVVGWGMERYSVAAVLGLMGVLGIAIVLPSAVMVARKIKG
jgi:MFS family permease